MYKSKFLYCVIAFFVLTAATSPIYAADYPNIQIREENGSSYIDWDGSELVVLTSNRYLTRFRATPLDEKWVGNHTQSTDLGWAYNDTTAKGLQVLSTAHYNNPAQGEFALVVNGKKPNFDSEISIIFKGIWMPEAAKFRYVLYMSFDCPLESWYQNTDGHRLEVTDYRIDYISKPERISSPAQKEPQMYEWFVNSADGTNWQKKPKIHVPYTTRTGDYITIRDKANLAQVGDYFGFLDKAQGGWMSKITKASAPVLYELCWMLMDVHIVFDNGVPPRYSTTDLSLEFEIEFNPVDTNGALEIINNAAEVNWRQAEEYKLPLFTKNNSFDTLITDIPSEETSNHYLWWASGYECFRDTGIGYQDNNSVSINQTTQSAQPLAWYSFSWGASFEDTSYAGHRVRLSAMVKTSNCAGQVRIGAASTSGDMWYGKGTHNADGTPKTDTGIKWVFSQPVTGTADWQLITVEFDVINSVNAVMLEQNGMGQSWFDNVTIEDMGPAFPVYKGDIPGELKFSGGGTAAMEGNALKLSQTGTIVQAAYVELATTGKDKKVTAEFQFKTAELTGWKSLYVFDENLKVAVPLHINANKLALNLGGGNYLQTGITVISNVWYTAKFVMDIDSHTYDVYIDGIRKVKNQAMNSSLGTRFRRIYLDTQGGTLYVQDVRAFKSEQIVASHIAGSQDFNNADFPMGSFMAGTADRTTISIDKTTDNPFLKISRTGADTNARIDFTATGSLVEINFKFMTTSFAGTKVMYLSDGWNVKVPLMMDLSVLKLYYGSLPQETVTVASLEPGQWYAVKALVDVENGKYDLYLDGAKMFENKPVANSTNKTINRMYFTAQTATTNLCIDDVSIYNVECGYLGYFSGDLNNDCYVNDDDLLLFAQAWLGSEYTETDFNQDSSTNSCDFAYLADQWLGCTNPGDSNCNGIF